MVVWKKINYKSLQNEIASINYKVLLHENEAKNNLLRVKENWTVLMEFGLKCKDLTDNEESFKTLMCMLFCIEGPLNVMVNSIVYVLLNKNKDNEWFREKEHPSRRIPKTFEDLFWIDWIHRIEYLEHHCMTCLACLLQTFRETRNVIAHQNFRLIDKNGTIKILGKRDYLPSEMRNNDLLKIYESIYQLIELFVEESGKRWTKKVKDEKGEIT